jgi:hypothetical protein
VHVIASTLADVAETLNDLTPPAEKKPHCVLLLAKGPMDRTESMPHALVVPVRLAFATKKKVNGAVITTLPSDVSILSNPSNDNAGNPF